MSALKNRRIVLAARPKGEPKDADFRLEELDVPVPEDGQVVLRTLYLSLDPYMRGRMNAARSYAKPAELNEVMPGATVSEVVESRTPRLSAGDIVLSYAGWQEYAVAPGAALMKLDPTAAPVSTALGVLGMPGAIADIGRQHGPEAGERLLHPRHGPGLQHVGVHEPHQVGHGCPPQARLVGVVIADQAVLHAGGRRDLPQADAVEALAGEGLQGGGQDGVARLLHGPVVAGRAAAAAGGVNGGRFAHARIIAHPDNNG